MFQHLLDDVKDRVGHAARLASVAAVMVIALFVAVSFLCAAAFICVFQRYGLITACLAGAAVFFLLGIICAVVYFVQKRHAKARSKAAPAWSQAGSDPVASARAWTATPSACCERAQSSGLWSRVRCSNRPPSASTPSVIRPKIR